MHELKGVINIFIYKITNIKTGQVYIGQTIRPVRYRFNRHLNDARKNILKTKFCKAIREYGEENFVLDIIDTASTQEELTEKEHYWIWKYDSVKSGYNETDAIFKNGGNTYAIKTKAELDEIKKKISESKIGEKNPNAKSVKCRNIYTGEELIFKTVKECRLYFNEKHHRFITNRVLHYTKSLYKSEWEIVYTDDEFLYELVDKNNNHA